MIIGSFVTCNNIDTSSCLTAMNTNLSVHDDVLDVNIDRMAEPDSSDEDNIDNELFTISPRTQLAQLLIRVMILQYRLTPGLKTDISGTNIPLRDVLLGKYYHFGIANGIRNHLIIENRNDQLIKLVIDIDGLPLTKSSRSTFWPILCYIRPHSNIVLPIGIYWGYDKPSDSNDFLHDFYEEVLNERKTTCTFNT